MKSLIVGVALLLLMGLILMPAFHQSFATTIDSFKLGGAGGGNMSGTDFRLYGSLGDIFAGVIQSGHFILKAGFLQLAVSGVFNLAGSNLGGSIITWLNGYPSTVTVDTSVTDPYLNYDSLLFPDDGTSPETVPLPHQDPNGLVITSPFADYTTTVQFFPGTIITGPASWDGKLYLPAELNPGAFTQDFLHSIIRNAVFLGLPGFDLTLNQPIKIFIQTVSLQAAFIKADGTVTVISTQCTGDNLASATAQLIAPLNACVTAVPGGLDIWTTEFSKFFGYTTIPIGGNLGDHIAPTLTGPTFLQNEYGLTINGNPFTIFTNPAIKTTISDGIAHVQVLLSEDSGPDAITGVVLFTNISGTQSARDSDTYIVWNKNQPQGVYDPHHIFSSVKVTNAVQSNKMLFTYDFVFAKSMQNSNLVIRAWDQRGNTKDTIITNAWQVTGSASSLLQTTPQPTQITPQSTQLIPIPTPATPQPNQLTTPENPLTQPTASSSEILSAVKDWGGYSPHPITDSDFLKSMNINDATHVPTWVSKTAKWVVDGSISLQDFQTMIAYLHQTHAIS